MVVVVVVMVVVMIWLDHGHDLDGFPVWICTTHLSAMLRGAALLKSRAGVTP
jgi:hypothetical protein